MWRHQLTATNTSPLPGLLSALILLSLPQTLWQVPVNSEQSDSSGLLGYYEQMKIQKYFFSHIKQQHMLSVVFQLNSLCWLFLWVISEFRFWAQTSINSLMYQSMQCIASWQCNVPCITKSLPITFSYLSPLVAGFSLVCLNFPQFFPPLSLVSILQPSSSKMSLSRCGISYSSYSLGISSLQQSSFH